MVLRRSSTGKKSDVDVHLSMECTSPSLSEAQTCANRRSKEEYDNFTKKFTESIQKRNAEIVEQGNHITVYEIDCTPQFPPTLIQSDQPSLLQTTPTTLLASSQSNVLLNGNVTSSVAPVFSGQQTYQLVVSPRMGLIVTPSTPGSVSNNPILSTVTSSTTTATNRPVAARGQIRSVISAINTATAQQSKKLPVVTGTATPSLKTPAISTNNIPSSPSTVISAVVSTRGKGKIKSDTNSAEITQSKATAAPTTIVDLTSEDANPVSISKESPTPRYPSRLYPSLVVVARPTLKIKEMSNSLTTAERTQLDTKVKGILTNSPTKFTEWLIQQGLVRSEQVCTNHTGDADLSSRKLKLGMYSDVSKFPYSGGYVWISECCPQKFISVFCNSIFEGAPHAPTIILKLMYHWACQTNVHNIISWVKVDHLYIKNFFTNLRAVCSAAVCEKFGKLGGTGKKIEVGVISLGTTTNNGSVRQVKVEVLGIMDPVSKIVRLRAVEPVQNAEKNHKLRFSKILESLRTWVHPSTTIITDFTVDRSALNDLGFYVVVQAPLNSTNRENNQGIMDYLKRVVPRMFQNTLSLLSRSIIQQFLDELVWRERWGAIASRAFDSLIAHLSEMTKLDTGDTLINRLKSITANPFRDWSYRNWKINSNLAVQHQEMRNTNSAEENKVMLGISSMSKTKINLSAAAPPKAGTSSKAESGKSSVTLTICDSSDEMNSPSAFSISEADEDNGYTSSSSGRRNKIRVSDVDDLKPQASSTLTLKPLEMYYYGTLPPDGVVLSKIRIVDLNIKCFVCGLTYSNNVQFMKHLAGHAQNEGAYTTEHQCKYCFKNFTTNLYLEDHVGLVHLPNKYNLMCLICTIRFKSRADLINHMQGNHVQLELPYQCNICKFRSSVHTKVIDHFYEVHNGGEKVQCPFCLKIVALESASGHKITQNANFFFSHIQRHQKKSIRKCQRCVLTFMGKALLKEHQAKDHISCAAMAGVIRNEYQGMGSTFMPTPSATRKSRSMNLNLPNISPFELYQILYYPDVPPGICIECKSVVSVSTHFTTYTTCMKCTYATCCRATLEKHFEKFHEQKGKRKISYRKPIPLEKPLYCACGYSGSCGNEMASHLIKCKRRVAYLSSERAAQYNVPIHSASFPKFINLDEMEQDSNDASDKWLRAFVKNCAPSDSDKLKSKKKINISGEKSPPRMLKELGLVRKESPSGEPDNLTDNLIDLNNSNDCDNTDNDAQTVSSSADEIDGGELSEHVNKPLNKLNSKQEDQPPKKADKNLPTPVKKAVVTNINEKYIDLSTINSIRSSDEPVEEEEEIASETNNEKVPFPQEKDGKDYNKQMSMGEHTVQDVEGMECDDNVTENNVNVADKNDQDAM